MVKGFTHKPRIKQLSPRDILDASKVGAMLRVTKSAEDPTQAKRGHALIRVMADAGLRVSEAVNLKADDVYLADGKKNQAIHDWAKSKAALWSGRLS
jgi:site-specific recombinase XerC